MRNDMQQDTAAEQFKTIWRDNHGTSLLVTAIVVSALACIVGYFRLIPEITANTTPGRPGYQAGASAGRQLIVDVSGFKSDDGLCDVSLYEVTSTTKADSPVSHASLPIDQLKAEWVVNDLPFGEYVVVAFHDLDGNGELSKVATGPKAERRGFSKPDAVPEKLTTTNDPLEAVFQNAKFTFDKDDQKVEVVVK